MKKTFVKLFLISLLFISCKQYDYWDISDFNLDNNALDDSEEVTIIYTSRGTDDKNAYIHYVVISKENLDTFNILSTTNFYLTKEGGSETFVFESNSSEVTRIVEEVVKEVAKNPEFDWLGPSTAEVFKKVYRDREFDYLAKNNHKTIIGSLWKKNQ